MNSCADPLPSDASGRFAAMGPVVVTCGGCGVRIRVGKPEAARGRPCPRCAAPLDGVLGRAIEIGSPAVVPPAAEAEPRSPRIAVHAALIVVAALVGVSV